MDNSKTLNNSNTLYISDLDGTLLNKSVELSAYTIDALNALIGRGLSFSVATARTLATAGRILGGLNLEIPIVLMNGVLIYDTKKAEYLKINWLAPETVRAVTRTLREFGVTGFMYEIIDGRQETYYESLEQKPLRDFVEERVTLYNKSFRQTDSFDSISPENITYFSLLDSYERILPVRRSLDAQPGLGITMYKDIYSPDLWYLEMFSSEASKRNAVVYLRETFGYGRIVGFGDNLNDLPMFEACDIAVAVENAAQEVREAADQICGANDADGVVRWLEEYA